MDLRRFQMDHRPSLERAEGFPRREESGREEAGSKRRCAANSAQTELEAGRFQRRRCGVDPRCLAAAAGEQAGIEIGARNRPKSANLKSALTKSYCWCYSPKSPVRTVTYKAMKKVIVCLTLAAFAAMTSLQAG